MIYVIETKLLSVTRVSNDYSIDRRWLSRNGLYFVLSETGYEQTESISE